MKIIPINWYERMVLWSRVGSMQAPNLQQAHVCLRILGKLRPSEEEVKVANLEMTEGNFRWRLPSVEYGSLQLELEDDECKALADGLDNHPQPVMVSDAAWMLELLEKLRAQPPAAVLPTAQENAA